MFERFFLFSSASKTKAQNTVQQLRGENGLGEGEEWQEFGAANTSLTLAYTGVVTSPDL